ncbi:MAG: hypothetical protein EAX91_04425 [Candidatus Lokiarchaeota archaeon]|nr:hypothetical protein [Candidatus Lokiarchaeota archaeon]
MNIIFPFLYNEREKCQQHINRMFEHSNKENMIRSELSVKNTIIFIQIIAREIKSKNILEFLTKKSRSIFNRTLKVKGKKIIINKQ